MLYGVVHANFNCGYVRKVTRLYVKIGSLSLSIYFCHMGQRLSLDTLAETAVCACMQRNNWVLSISSGILLWAVQGGYGRISHLFSSSCMISSGRLHVKCAESAVINCIDHVLDRKNLIWFSDPSLTFQGWWLSQEEERIFWFVGLENKLKKGGDRHHTAF